MIKVLVVDDSAVVRQILQGALSSDPEIQVVVTAIRSSRVISSSSASRT